MAMKYFLVLVAAIGFLPIWARRAKPPKILFYELVTELAAVREEIVNTHNTLRRGVIPPASNMLKMNWSEGAAQNARAVSTYCDIVESNPVERRIGSTFCGENMHMTTQAVSWSHVIRTWYNESKYFKYGQWTSTDDDKATDHYTQIVWATSYLVGCGITSCRKGGLPRYIYVCHYCHEGNDPDTKNRPYKTGTICGDCPNDCEDKLCTNPCIYYDEYAHCEQQVRGFGCNHVSTKLFCQATCLCKTEIR
uniref:Cysteine rich secretory protein 1 n=1 Tax=Microcebus murinus TaxID=30608 RepID=A0A8C5UMY7_MICMU